MKPTPEQIRFAMRMHSSPNAERLSLMRNGYLSAGTLCLAIVIALTQVSVRGVAFNTAVIAGALAMPILFAAAALYESYLLLGIKSYPFIETQKAMKITAILTALGTVSTLICINAILWILTPYATATFCVAGFLAYIIVVRFIKEFSEWWYAEDGPGIDEPRIFELENE